MYKRQSVLIVIHEKAVDQGQIQEIPVRERAKPVAVGIGVDETEHNVRLRHFKIQRLLQLAGGNRLSALIGLDEKPGDVL